MTYKIKCPYLKDSPAGLHSLHCICNGTGQINPEISAEDIERVLYETKTMDELRELRKQKFIPSSAVQEIVENSKKKLLDDVDKLEVWFQFWYEYSWNKQEPSEEIREIKKILEQIKL